MSCLAPQPKDIQFTVSEVWRNQKTVTFVEAGIRDVTRTIIDSFNLYSSELSPCPANTATTPCRAKSDLLYR